MDASEPTASGMRHELLARLLAEEGIAFPQTQSPQPRVRDGLLPLSFAQERLWFLEQYEPGSPVYNVPAAYRFRGPLDARVLEESLNAIIDRHEVLRTTFTAVEGKPCQVIAQAMTLALPVVELGELSEAHREAEAWRLMGEEAKLPFDLASGPLIRASLLRLTSREHILFLSMHHIICDEWSTEVFLRELSVLYEANVTGNPSSLEALPVQYADYALWQRQWLQGDALDAQFGYWREQLAGAPASPDLPTDYPRPARQTYEGAYESLPILTAPQLQRLHTLSRQANATLFMTLLAAFKTLLHRYTGAKDVVVGSPIANRNRIEIEDLVGFFVNTLVLRTDLSGNPTFRELLGRVRDVALEAYSHQELPFEKLVADLIPDRDLSHSPLFQLMFVLETIQDQSMDVGGLATEPLDLDSATAKFDLTLFVREQVAGLSTTLEYNTDLFEAATMRRMLGHFQVLLNGILDSPDLPIQQLPLLTEADRHQLQVEWIRTHSEYPRHQCVQHLFETQAERSPDAWAVQFEDQGLTYCDLDVRANQLAHYLRRHDVGPDVLVGICIERSLEMVIGMLGILKAGGAYLPLDLSLPRERLAFMLEDAEVTLLLTQDTLLHLLPEHRARAICLDTAWSTIAQESSERPASPVTAENLAYVLYTSGSTGMPKGVAMQHRPLHNLVQWQVQNSALSHGARMLQFSPLNFDASFTDLFWSWASGGTAVMIPAELRRDSPGILALLAQQAIERINVPVSSLTQLAEAATREPVLLESLGEIATTAEQLQITRPVVALFEQLPGSTLQNQYGPTETHVVTACTLNGAPAGWPVLPPIGRAIANIQIYLLDGHLQPVPVGVTGELYVGGDGLARGYLNRPGLTAEKFIPNPFHSEPGARMYATGDLACYRSDGQIEFLGRNDHQVKIRGFRVELGEVESALGQHPAVRGSAAVVRQDHLENKRLVAYLVLNQEPATTTNELRDFVSKKLPAYMVPSTFSVLNALPLTPSGKIDRQALPEPEWTGRDLDQAFVAPSTPEEEALASIWTGLLGVQQPGVHDSFFELGGHSLLAMQVVSRVRDTFDVELRVRSLFEAPTIAGLAQIIAQMLADNLE